MSYKARTGPRSAAGSKPEVHARSKLTKCPEQEQQQPLGADKNRQ